MQSTPLRHDVPVPDDRLALQRLHHFEAHEPDRVAFVQPMGAAHGGEVRELTWRQAIGPRIPPSFFIPFPELPGMQSIHHLPPAAAGSPFVAADTPPGDLVERLARQSTLAHEALMQGDIARYRSLVSLADDFTLMAPFGGPPTRSGLYSEEQWAAIGSFFQHGENSTLELVRAYPSPELVVLVAIERSDVQVGSTPPQHWALRVTLVFSRDAEGWKLAHRHADPLVAGITVEHAATLARETHTAPPPHHPRPPPQSGTAFPDKRRRQDR